MILFSCLYRALEQTTSTNAKVEALEAYFRAAPPEDAAWAVYVLSGRRLLRLLPSKLLRAWTTEVAGVSDWLLDECYAAVGDLAETTALLLDGVETDRSLVGHVPLHVWIDRLEALRGQDDEARRALVLGWWRDLETFERFLLNKLLTGELRVGVSQTLVVRALANVAGLEPAVVTQRLTGTWTPSAEGFRALVSPDAPADEASRPYPFCLAYPLETEAVALGAIADWQAEWKWDGIRAQLIRRGGEVHLWSRGEEVITARFPEVTDAAARLPDGSVLDGEILAWRDADPLPFATLQLRIGRQTLTRRVLEQAPVVFMAYDLLEVDGRDLRQAPLSDRRARLESLLTDRGGSGDGALRLSPLVTAASWQELGQQRATSRERGVEGFMLKRLDSPYGTGRRKGDWWKWKVDPYAVDAVLVYAQAGHGRRASLFTDYTFAVWKGDELVPIAKAYSGLSNDEIEELDRWVRAHTIEKFGPVRRVPPVHVFEIAFENVQRSTRHKSGVAVRFPRIARWRTDKRPEDADNIDALEALIGG